MNKILATALQKLPHTLKTSEVRFYWRIILDKFRGNEEQIIARLNKEFEDYDSHRMDETGFEKTKKRYEILCRMKELDCATATRLWIALKHGGECNLNCPARDKFVKLSRTEQLSVVEENLNLIPETDDSDAGFLLSLISTMTVEGSAASVVRYLRDTEAYLLKSEAQAFVKVIKIMLETSHQLPPQPSETIALP
jgi:hypothetical protein